jgi:hypothetical protein
MVGFEPTEAPVTCDGVGCLSGLGNRRFKPLSHISLPATRGRKSPGELSRTPSHETWQRRNEERVVEGLQLCEFVERPTPPPWPEMPNDDDTAHQRALKRRKELQDVIARAMQDLEKVEQFLALYRQWAAPEVEEQPGAETAKPYVTLARAGHGKSQAVFEQLVRAVLFDVQRPLRSPEIVEELRKRGNALGGNETRTAWNRLWQAKRRGVLINVEPHGYWLSDEPLPEGALDAPKPRKYRPKGQGAVREEWRGRRIGRERLATDAQLEAIRKALIETDRPLRDIARSAGVSPGTIYNYFPGGRAALREQNPDAPQPPQRLTTTVPVRAPRLSLEVRERILFLHKTGMSTSQIAREVGLNKTTVWRAVKAATRDEGQPQP